MTYLISIHSSQFYIMKLNLYFMIIQFMIKRKWSYFYYGKNIRGTYNLMNLV